MTLHAFLTSALGGVEYLLHDPTKFFLKDKLTVSVRQLRDLSTVLEMAATEGILFDRSPLPFFERFSFNPYPTAFPYGNGMVLHFYQQQESSTTKTVHKVINKGLKTYV